MPFCYFTLKASRTALRFRNLVHKGFILKPETLGQHLRSRRLVLNLTQAQTAKRLNTLREHYERWERDEVAPTASFWPRLIGFLGMYPGDVQTPADWVLKARRLLGLSQFAFGRKIRVIAEKVREWEHHAKASKGDLQGMIADYETVVDFLDKGLLTRDAIGADEQAHRAKWPVGSEKIVGEIRIVQEGRLWQAEYTIEFYNENGAGEWHKGQADLTLRLKEAEKTLSIMSQRAKVYDVTNSKQPPKAPAAGAVQQPQAVPISVPKPCFVAVTRAKDLGQIEFTDQISFAGAVTWHRTYRELSPDGKVLNVCRAIYEGNGGVLPNRQGARIYVGSQGWHRTMGTPAFVRLCERSAAALVGREFIFQFTQNGMIESNTGTTFKLVK